MLPIDLYECTYQKISKQIAKKDKKVYYGPSDLRRRTLEEIRCGLKMHIALEDIDSRDYFKWPAEKKLSWLQDVNEFIYKILGKKKYIKLRDLRNKE